MKRVVLLGLVVVGCGGGGDAKPDVYVQQGPDYDLSCLGNTVTSVPTTITFDTTIYDITTLPMTPLVTAASATITARALADSTVTGMGTSDMDGKLMLEMTTTGSPARMSYTVEGAGLVKSVNYNSIPPYKSSEALFVASGQARLDALATALGQTLDPSKGVLEVWASDCSIKTELPGATLLLDNTQVPWAMFAGVGVWVPRETTLAHLPNITLGSQAGTVNVTPGMHTVTVNAGSLSVTTTVNIEAGTWTMVVVLPGVPLT